MNENTVAIGEEAFNRLRVEAAAGRGLKIECFSRLGLGAQWALKVHARWNWDEFEYRIAKPEPGKRTRAELLDQINALVAELRGADA